MDYQIQVIAVPVTAAGQAAVFYTRQAGFTLDVDYHPAPGFRVVQLTPPGSACSVQIGAGLTDAALPLTVGLDHPGRLIPTNRGKRRTPGAASQATHSRTQFGTQLRR